MGVRTPIVFSLPGRVPSGAIQSALASTTDVFATLLDYGGAPPPAAGSGRSLRPVIEGTAESVRAAVIGYMPASESDASGGYFLRTSRWYFIDFEAREDELYDMERDPAQQRDVAAEHPSQVELLRARIDAWKAGVRSYAGL